MSGNAGFLDTWTEDEENTVVSWHETLGAKWNKIALKLPGRSAAEIEKFWNLKGRWRNLSAEDRIAHVVGRRWRLRSKHRARLTLRRAALIERLQVENKLQTGLWRLLSYIALFFLIIFATTLGTPSIQRRAVGTLLEDALFLTEFGTLNRLENVRDFLPTFSSAIKQFSASSSSRFKDADAYQLLGGEAFFTAPMTLATLKLPVATRSFTLTAWVRDNGVAQGVLQPLVRKPLATDPIHSCWAWYYPSVFKYGAHDYHSINMMNEKVWEETVIGNPPSWQQRNEGRRKSSVAPGGGGKSGFSSSASESAGVGGRNEGLLSSGRMTHEAMVVTNETVTFYRAGKVLGDPVLYVFHFFSEFV